MRRPGVQSPSSPPSSIISGSYPDSCMVCPLETDGYTSCVHIGGYEGQAMSFYPDKTSPYITKHRDLPTFRIRIPADLQTCLGKAEYRRSIGRCYAPEAKLRALRLAIAALEFFSLTRSQTSLLSSSIRPSIQYGEGNSAHCIARHRKAPVRRGFRA